MGNSFTVTNASGASSTSLSLDYAALADQVTDYLGMGRDYDSLGSSDAAMVDKLIQDGLRRFYYPDTGHDWGFLKPLTTLSIVAGTTAYDLPTGFGRLMDQPVLQTDDAPVNPLPVVDEGLVRAQLYAYPSRTGPPEAVAVRPKSSDGSAVQLFELVLFPEPDAAYTLGYRYQINPGALVEAKYPYGGQQHAGTIAQACLAEAELKRDDVRGPQEERFQQMLAGSILRDQRDHAAQYLGYNADRSDGVGPMDRRGLGYVVKYDNVIWGD